MSRTKLRQRAVVFGITLVAMLVADFSAGHAAGLVRGFGGSFAVARIGSINTPLGYPYPLSASRRRPMMTPRVVPQYMRIYRVIQPHIITVAMASVRSNNDVLTGGRHEERIAFGTAPADGHPAHSIAIVRGTKTSFVLFP